MARIDLDLDTVNEVGEFNTPVPPGNYVSQAIDSDVKPVSSGRGVRAAYSFEILEGEYKGRKFFDGFNFVHEDKKTQEIGAGRLKKLCSACHFSGKLQDTSAIHKVPFIAKLRVKEAEGNYGAKNEVADYLPMKNNINTQEQKVTGQVTPIETDDIPF